MISFESDETKAKYKIVHRGIFETFLYSIVYCFIFTFR